MVIYITLFWEKYKKKESSERAPFRLSIDWQIIMHEFTFRCFSSCMDPRHTKLAALEWLQYLEGGDSSCLVGILLLFSFPVQEWDYCLGRVKSISGIRNICPQRCWASINSFWFLLIHPNSPICAAWQEGVHFVLFLIFFYFSIFLFSFEYCFRKFSCQRLSLGISTHEKLMLYHCQFSISFQWEVILLILYNFSLFW